MMACASEKDSDDIWWVTEINLINLFYKDTDWAWETS